MQMERGPLDGFARRLAQVLSSYARFVQCACTKKFSHRG